MKRKKLALLEDRAKVDAALYAIQFQFLLTAFLNQC